MLVGDGECLVDRTAPGCFGIEHVWTWIDLDAPVIRRLDPFPIDRDVRVERRVRELDRQRRHLRREADRPLTRDLFEIVFLVLGRANLRPTKPVQRGLELSEHLVAEAQVQHRAGCDRIETDRPPEGRARLGSLPIGQERAALREQPVTLAGWRLGEGRSCQRERDDHETAAHGWSSVSRCRAQCLQSGPCLCAAAVPTGAAWS